MKSFILFFSILLPSLSFGQSECLRIQNFSELASFTDFDDDRAWTLSNLIRTPYDLRRIDNERIRRVYGIDGMSFMLQTRFQGEGIYWETIKVNGTSRSYDIYIYEAGDNGAGFIFETDDVNTVVATISDKDINGCLKY